MSKRAILSVYDKDGIVNLAKGLIKASVELVSTGGTYKLLNENGLDVKTIEEVTGFPEIFNGRVKTLHPMILGGILMNRKIESHISEAEKLGIVPIDIVVVNLYPFKETVSQSDITVDKAIEEIDIGGVTLLRAAAKNFQSVDVLVSKDQYQNYLSLLNEHGMNIPEDESLKLAYKAFEHIADYDVSIKKYFYEQTGGDVFSNAEKSEIHFALLQNPTPLRYGENPHQKAVMFASEFDENFKVFHGKELSYNNILDVSAAYDLISEFENDAPTCAIIKHGNPSGVSTSKTIFEAYQRAFNTDTASPFGGIIIFNGVIDFKTTQEVDKLFTEIIIATGFEPDALELLMKKKNRRLIEYKFFDKDFELRSFSGGYLLQDRDNIVYDEKNLKVVTERKPDERELSDMKFAFKIVKHIKSNAIVFVKDNATLAIGCGQPSRIDSTKIAVSKAKQFGHSLESSVVASDAFFPFADGLIALADAGARAVIQPGGSVKDDEVISAANERGIAMVFTGIRHFKH